MRTNEPLQSVKRPTPRDKAPKLSVQYHSRRALLSAIKTEGSKLTLFVASEITLPVGSAVGLGVAIAGTNQTFDLFGTVMNHAWAGAGSRSSGLTVLFQGEDKKHAAEMVAFCADRPPAMGTANSERFRIEVRCKVKGAQASCKGTIVDLSRTGAFVATPKITRGMQTGAHLRVHLDPGIFGLGGTWVDAKVIWQGDKDTQTGFGIQFVGLRENQTKALNNYLKGAHR